MIGIVHNCTKCEYFIFYLQFISFQLQHKVQKLRFYECCDVKFVILQQKKILGNKVEVLKILFFDTKQELH